MQTNQWLALSAFLYVGVLFFIAWWADRRGHRRPVVQAFIYSLSLAVYCSSWTFFGAVGKAAQSGWAYAPIYLGPILLFLFAWPFLRRLSAAAARNRVTSVADFVGARFGKSQALAALVTGIAVLGSLPYIALQLKATTQAWASVQGVWNGGATVESGSASFVAALLLVLFTVAFGTRVVDERHRHRGLMAAIAVESLVKLLAFFLVGCFALIYLLDLGGGLKLADSSFGQLPEPVNFVTQSLLAAAAIFCLPRQFHVMNVEYHSRRDLRTARWVFPLYLLLFALMIVPITLMGQQVFIGNQAGADMFVVSAPLALGSPELALIALLGGLSAATGMVIVASLTVSVMVCNEWVMPLWLAIRREHQIDARWLQRVRRIAIATLLVAAWLLERRLVGYGGLASLGLISFAAAAQLAPVVLAAIYWRRAHRRGVIAGLLAGGGLWFYCLLLPAVLGQQHELIAFGPWGLTVLAPENLAGLGALLDPLSHGVFWSLSANTLCLVLVSLWSRFRPIDLRQARAFTDLHLRQRQRRSDLELQAIEVRQLRPLLAPMLGEARAQALWRRFEARLGHRLLPTDRLPRFVVKDIEEALAGLIGAVSAHRTIELLRSKRSLEVEEFVTLIGSTSRDIKFGQDLLQITLETIPQGVSVVDENLNLVAWNRRYVDLFDFPERLLYIGCPVAKIYHYNAERGYLQDADHDVDAAVDRRLAMLRSGQAYKLERRLPNGRTIEICGTPMLRGGYVTTYTDVSENREVLRALEHAKEELEQRVVERTADLAQVNRSLAEENTSRARIEQELNAVYTSKNRFMAAASHDLLQPINAARLFAATLAHKTAGQPLANDVSHIDEALANAEALITSLREMSQLDSGRMTVRRERFPLQDLLDTLGREFSVIAERSGLSLKVMPCSLWVETDPHLLRRVVQNLLGNALRYTRRGRVLLGCRRVGSSVAIEVWDTGPGIAEADQRRVFGEFERGVDAIGDSEAGLGLGLSIVQRISQLLGCPIELASSPGKGSKFAIVLPTADPVAAAEKAVGEVLQSELAGLKVLCIDNEAAIRLGMQGLLTQWQCVTRVADSLGEALAQWNLPQPPDIVLADYHLDQGTTGLDVLKDLSYHWQQPLRAIVISADNTSNIREAVSGAGFQFLAKPVKPAALRAVMRRLAQK